MLFGWHSRCHISSTSDHSHSLSVLLRESVSLLKRQKGFIYIYIYMRWVFLHIYRITRGSKHLTFPLLRFPLAHLIWFHFCWPGCTAHHNEQQLHKVCLKPSWSKRKSAKVWQEQLTSTITISIFTSEGKSNSGWKHLTMATSRWRVARRSLLWMTDR